jgi:uncharacterized RDD family membrane protein YckC
MASPPPQNETGHSLVERTVTPVARVAWRSARGVARRLGLDRAVSDAVESGTARALDSETAARATQRLLDTDTANRVWDKVLESPEAQKLVERVAEAPEVRAAIASQGVGLLQDLRRVVRRLVREADTVVERIARKILRRQLREERPIYAGAISRLAALAIDGGVVYGSLLLLTAAIAAVVAAVSRGDQHAGTVAIAFGATVWLLVAAGYLLVLWSGAGRTVGMSFLALRMLSEDAGEVRPSQAVRRLIWMPIAALPLFLGFAGILTREERRGWPDRRAGTIVCYADPELDKDLV